MEISSTAAEIKREYYRKYREKNADRLKAYKRSWNANNKDKVANHKCRYWEKRAAKEITSNSEK